MCVQTKNVIERNRDLIYVKFVATDFFRKIIGRAKRAPHWGVQSRFRVIYIYIQVKKKAFKINAKNEDVGLNED